MAINGDTSLPSVAPYRRRRRLVTRVMTGVAIIMISVGAPALGSGPDESSARQYAAASEMTLRAMSRRLPESEATIRQLVAGIRMRCPGVAGHPPSNQQSTALRQEIAIAIVLAFVAPDRSYIRRFIATVGRISWRSTRIAALVGASNAEGMQLIAGAVPNVCRDLKTWAESRYRVISPETITLTRLGSALGFALLEGNIAARGHLLTLIKATSSKADAFAQALKIRRELRKALLRLGSRSTRAIYAAIGWG